MYTLLSDEASIVVVSTTPLGWARQIAFLAYSRGRPPKRSELNPGDRLIAYAVLRPEARSSLVQRFWRRLWYLRSSDYPPETCYSRTNCPVEAAIVDQLRAGQPSVSPFVPWSPS